MTRISLNFVLFFILNCAYGSDVGTFVNGTESGNAKFSDYYNSNLHLKLKVPVSWDRTDLGRAVTFKEKIMTDQVSGFGNYTAANFVTVALPKVRTESELRKYVEIFHSNRIWSSKEFAGRPGYISADENEGMIYILKSSGEILLVQFKVRADGNSENVMSFLLNSMEFD